MYTVQKDIFLASDKKVLPTQFAPNFKSIMMHWNLRLMSCRVSRLDSGNILARTKKQIFALNTVQNYFKLKLMKTIVNGDYQKRCRSLNQMTFTLHKRNTFMWDIVKKVRWQDFYWAVCGPG